MYCVALRLSPCDITQQATWRPPCGVRRVIQKRSQLYTKKSNVSRNFLYGLSMSSSPNLNIHLLWVFFSFKTRHCKPLLVSPRCCENGVRLSVLLFTETASRVCWRRGKLCVVTGTNGLVFPQVPHAVPRYQ